MNPLRPSNIQNRTLAPPSANEGVQKRTSGTVTSLQRKWSTPTLNVTHSPPSSQNRIMSSSQPSWQANESEWPPSSPPKPKAKATVNMPYQNPTKSNGTHDKPSSSTSSTSKTVIRTKTGFQANSTIMQSIAQRAPTKPKPSAKRDFPWDVGGPNAKKLAGASRVTLSTGTSQLGNPKLSISAKVSLSKEQQAVLDQVLKGESVFFTGSAGTGKSVLLRHIIAALKQSYKNKADAVVVTASTGMAACAIGGTTIHSFAGVGIALESPDLLVSKVRKNKKAVSRWTRTRVLIIDEISMVDGDLFDKLAYVAQKMKRSDKPFGGIQLVIAGDFFQLPPVSKGNASFAFNAKRWKECISQTVNLTQVFRQKDSTFVDMLNEMRMGTLSSSSIQKFRALSREIKYDDGIMPTELYPTRHEVEKSNLGRLNALDAETVTYISLDSGKGTPEQRARDLNNMMAVDKLVLKVGAQVMMIKNQSSEDGPGWLVNGLVGKVESFEEVGATTAAAGERDSCDESSAGKTARGTKQPTKSAGSATGTRNRFPVVAWRLPTGRIEKTTVEHAEFKVENAEGEVQSKRVQLPLILAWAMSIHKSQGQTLSRVKVDLGKVFEKGQSYVALSRATSLDGLQVLRFEPHKVMAHPEVIKWSKNLLTIN